MKKHIITIFLVFSALISFAQSDPAPKPPYSVAPIQGFTKISGADTIHTGYQSGYGFFDIAGRSWSKKNFAQIPDGILSGLTTNVTGTNAIITSGKWVISVKQYAKITSTTIALDTRDATLSRYDVVLADTNNNIYKLSGTLSANPNVPDIPAGTLDISEILITPTSVSNKPPATGYVYKGGAAQTITSPLTLKSTTNFGTAIKLDYTPTTSSGTGLVLGTDSIVHLGIPTVSGVSTFNGRSGAVVPIPGDYTTSSVPEGSNLYLTNTRVIGSALTGYTSSSGTITSGDNILQAIQKLNGNITTASTTINGTSIGLGTSGTITANTPNSLTPGYAISGSAFNGSSQTWAADTTSSTALVGKPRLTTALALYQHTLNLTTTGATGTAATLTGNTLNIPTPSLTYGSYTQNGIGSTLSDAILLQNTTAAVSGTQQYSPAIHFKAQGFAPSSSISKSDDFYMNVMPYQNGNGLAYLQIESSLAGTTPIQIFSLDNNGDMFANSYYSPGYGSFGNLKINGGTTWNLTIPDAQYGQVFTNSGYLFAGASSVFARMIFNGTASTSAVGLNSGQILANVIFANASSYNNTPSSTTGWIVNALINSNNFIPISGGILTNNANLYINYPSNSATNNYALYIAGGLSRFDVISANTPTGTSTDSLVTKSGSTLKFGAVPSTNFQKAASASNDLTSQTTPGTITSVTSAAANSTYNIGAYLNVTAIATDIIQVQITYTDENNIAQTISFNTISSISNSTYNTVTIRVKASTTITIKTNNTVNSGSETFDAGAYISKAY